MNLAFVVQRFQPEEPRRVAQLFFDPQQLVVLGDAVGARCRTGLDLPSSGRHGQIRDERIFGLARAVRDDRRVPIAAGQVDGIQSFAHRADLIHLDQDRIGHAFVDSLLQAFALVTNKIVADQLDLAADLLRSDSSSHPSRLRRGRLRWKQSDNRCAHFAQ